MTAVIKQQLRRDFSLMRRTLPIHRRIAAEEKVCEIAKLFDGPILSFASKPEEINLWLLNLRLAKEKRLLLPKVQGKELLIHEVTDISTQLQKGRFGILEPIPELCRIVEINEIRCILVPGLAFDQDLQRLGWGGGYFDRFLINTKCPKIGVGFEE
ncbi:MAG: hypothetical protein ACD_79C00456G0001, partial [uncultured bacterium]